LRKLNVLRGAALAVILATAAPARADAPASMAAYNQAFAHFQAGDLRAARVELLNALKEDSGNGVARLLFARVQIARGNGVAAQTEIERAVKAGIPREKTYHLTANALLLQNQAGQALQMASNSRIPPQFGAYAARMRGRAQLGLNHPTEAAREFADAVRLAPGSSPAWTDLARYQFGTGHVPEGIKSIDRAIALDGNSVEALNLKGSVSRATQGLASGLPWFDRAIKVDTNSIESLLERAATLSDMGRYDAARADLKHVLGLIPSQPFALYLSAVVAARENKYQDAEALLAQTKGVLDKYPPAQLLRANIALKQNNLGVAFENLSAAVASNPGNLGARRMLAQVQLQRGDARGALVTLEPVAKIPNLDAPTLALIGAAHAQVGDFPAAQGFYERAAKLAPNLPGLDTQLAMTRMAQGDAKGATAGLSEVLKKDPKSLQALTSLAYVNLRGQDYRGAYAAADRIVAAYPKNAVGYTLRGTAAFALKDTKRAESDFRAAIAADPKFPEAHSSLAQLLLATGRTDAAKTELRAMVASDPRNVRAMMMLADVAGRARALPERVDWLKRAVLVNPKDPGPRAALIATYLAQQQGGQALTEATALARDLPNNTTALQLLAGAQIANKQPSLAVATVKRIVDLAPQSPEAKLLLARAQMATGPAGYNDARATLQGAIRQGGPGVDQAYIGLVQLELAAKNPDAALAEAEKLKSVTTQKVAADKLIGDVNMAAGRAPAALAAYQRVRAQANNGATAALVARAQSAMGQGDVALKTLADFRAANPKDLLGGVALAEQYIARKDWRAAISTYLTLRNTPAADSPEVLNNLAFAYNEVGDPRAVAAAARANVLAPGQPTIEDTYGWVLVRSGRDAKRGLALLQDAAKAMGSDPNVHFHLGMAYKANGKNADAARELRAALASPGLDNAAAAREALASVGG